MTTKFRQIAALLLLVIATASASGCGLLSFGAGAATGAVVEDEVDDDED